MINVIESPSAVFFMKSATGMSLYEILQKTKAKPESTYRQVLIWFLWEEGVPMTGIIDITQLDRTTIINSKDKINDLISVNDKETILLIKSINALKYAVSI